MTAPPHTSRLAADELAPTTFDAAHAFSLLQWVNDHPAVRWQALYRRRSVPVGVLTRNQRHMSDAAAQRLLRRVELRAPLLYHALRWLEVGTPRSEAAARPTLALLPTLIEFLSRAAVFHEPAYGRVE